MLWPFAKYVGCGNDFILFDNRQGTFPLFQIIIQQLCQRRSGIGADGLLLLENSNDADCRMRIFNCDGNEAEMCGNGLRCFVKWLASMGFQNPYRIQVMQSILTVRGKDNAITIEMENPRNIQWDIPLRFENQFLRVHYLNTGVPHTVLLMDDIEQVDLAKLGAHIRNYSLWMPKGTNVTIAQKLGHQRLKIRTYERGIEGETWACGTGATAAALVAAKHYDDLSSPVTIETRSGEELVIDFVLEDQHFSKVTLTGPAECTFLGEINLPVR
jgi:diaminopimelate epimerase